VCAACGRRRCCCDARRRHQHTLVRAAVERHPQTPPPPPTHTPHPTQPTTDTRARAVTPVSTPSRSSACTRMSQPLRALPAKRSTQPAGPGGVCGSSTAAAGRAQRCGRWARCARRARHRRLGAPAAQGCADTPPAAATAAPHSACLPAAAPLRAPRARLLHTQPLTLCLHSSLRRLARLVQLRGRARGGSHNPTCVRMMRLQRPEQTTRDRGCMVTGRCQSPTRHHHHHTRLRHDDTRPRLPRATTHLCGVHLGGLAALCELGAHHRLAARRPACVCGRHAAQQQRRTSAAARNSSRALRPACGACHVLLWPHSCALAPCTRLRPHLRAAWRRMARLACKSHARPRAQQQRPRVGGLGACLAALAHASASTSC
jgi:hypothetical protein